MDAYLSVRKPTTAPYPPRTKLDEDRQRWSKLLAPVSVDGKKPSSSTITKHLLNTLSDNSNPVTHSNIYERSDTVVSATTGHQRGEGRTPHGVSDNAYFNDRSRKLSLQRRDEAPKGVLSNVRIYIDGYLSGTTDIEMRRIIAQAGGTTLYVPNSWLSYPVKRCIGPYRCFRLAPSGATHIMTSQLNGSKTHRIRTTKSRNPVHVVKPEWVTDSIAAGRRLQEFHYTLIKSSSTRNLVDIMVLNSGGSR
ncbi:hypothetical protein J3R82DRAFT_4291 [Butyriboletus roseoflavus]|nr:hypothetical protein J3R82DRAFT_4291 [Butyriboletus roseoflavus]